MRPGLIVPHLGMHDSPKVDCHRGSTYKGGLQRRLNDCYGHIQTQACRTRSDRNPTKIEVLLASENHVKPVDRRRDGSVMLRLMRDIAWSSCECDFDTSIRSSRGGYAAEDVVPNGRGEQREIRTGQVDLSGGHGAHGHDGRLRSEQRSRKSAMVPQ